VHVRACPQVARQHADGVREGEPVLHAGAAADLTVAATSSARNMHAA
jgi:hypothetical protein